MIHIAGCQHLHVFSDHPLEVVYDPRAVCYACEQWYISSSTPDLCCVIRKEVIKDAIH